MGEAIRPSQFLRQARELLPKAFSNTAPSSGVTCQQWGCDPVFQHKCFSLLSWLGPCIIVRTSQRVGDASNGCLERAPAPCFLLPGGMAEWHAC